MSKAAPPADIGPALSAAYVEFWQSYFAKMLTLHTGSGRTLREPIRDGNPAAGATSKHGKILLARSEREAGKCAMSVAG